MFPAGKASVKPIVKIAMIAGLAGYHVPVP